MEVNVTERDIKRDSINAETYNKGIEYYRQGRATISEVNEAHNIVIAKVSGSGTKVYNTRVRFSDAGQVNGAYCDCPAFDGYTGHCKHIVALIKTFQEKNIADKKVRTQLELMGNLIYSFDDEVIGERELITLEPIVSVIEYEFSTEKALNLTFRIGAKKKYMLKNVNDFLYAYYRGGEIEYGKEFTYNPNNFYFDEVDEKLIVFLSDINVIDRKRRGYGTENLINKRTVTLTDKLFKDFIDIAKDKKIEFNIEIRAAYTSEKIRSKVIQKDLDLALKIEEGNGKNVIISDQTLQSIFSITSDYSYIISEGELIRTSKDQEKYLKNFYDYSKKTGGKLTLDNTETNRFISRFMPKMENVVEIKLDKRIKNKIVKAECKCDVFLDKMGDNITAKLDFVYRDTENNNIVKDRENSDKIMVFSDEKENKITEIFEKRQFERHSKEKEKFILSNDDNIYEFIQNDIAELSNYADIYYTDNFKSIIKEKTNKFSVNVRLNQDTNILEIKFTHPDIDKKDLADILSSYKLKKKYHRLKNGGFVSLEDGDIKDIEKLVSELDISKKEIERESIYLPSYRALYLDESLNKDNYKEIEKDESFKRLVEDVKNPKEMDIEVTEEMKPILRGYQITGYKWLKTLANYGFGGILADDMGLGKTLQMITYLLSEKGNSDKPVLIVAPTSLVYNWKDEFEKFIPDKMNIVIISGSKKEREESVDLIDKADVVITSYPLIRRDLDFYEGKTFSCCILDEAQHIKNPHSQTAHAVKSIKSKNRFALTGTPIENSLTELWSIFDFVMPKYLHGYSKFNDKYQKNIIKNQDEEALRELTFHIKPFMMRRLKKDVLEELPEKIETKMVAELGDEQKKLYLAHLAKAKEDIKSEINTNGFENSKIKILAILTRLRQICCHPSLFIENYKGESGKLELLEEVLDDAIEGGHKVLLFSQFTSMLAIIKEVLDNKKIKYSYLDGSTRADKRKGMVDEFNAGDNQVFLISLKAGGTGLNLTSADMVIHFDPWWNPAVEEQASDRAHRIGQKNVVQVIKLIAKGTIEEKIYELQQRKKQLIDSVIANGETFITKMTEAEISSLFE